MTPHCHVCGHARELDHLELCALCARQITEKRRQYLEEQYDLYQATRAAFNGYEAVNELAVVALKETDEQGRIAAAVLLAFENDAGLVITKLGELNTRNRALADTVLLGIRRASPYPSEILTNGDAIMDQIEEKWSRDSR